MEKNSMRPMMEYINNRSVKKKLTGVEIGVFNGINAIDILEHIPIKKLYLVDPYKTYRGYDTNEIIHGSLLQKQFDNIYYNTRKKILKKYGNKVDFIRKKSEDAIKTIPNNLDFVYIDGSHAYKYVKQDIEFYYPKIKNGGVIGGHDYGRYGVTKAVNQFHKKNNLKLYTSERDVHTGEIDWFVVKGDT